MNVKKELRKIITYKRKKQKKLKRKNWFNCNKKMKDNKGKKN